MSKPTPGRIVLYRPTQREQSACSEHPKATARAVVPAIVISADEDTVNLKAFQDSPQDLYVSKAKEGEEEGQWSWPPKTTDPEDLGTILGVNTDLLDSGKIETTAETTKAPAKK